MSPSVDINGQQVNVRDEDFEIEREEWNSYILLDGGKIRVKTSVLRIYRMLNEQGQPAFTPEGEPAYWVVSRNEIVPKVR